MLMKLTAGWAPTSNGHTLIFIKHYENQTSNVTTNLLLVMKFELKSLNAVNNEVKFCWKPLKVTFKCKVTF